MPEKRLLNYIPYQIIITMKKTSQYITAAFAGLCMAASLQAATVTGVASRPTGDILAETSPDGSVELGFDAEERSPSNVRYAWGQSFTATTSWELDKISVLRSAQAGFLDTVEEDTQIKIVLIEYASATFNADVFGPFSDPLPTGSSNSVEVLSETFDWTVGGSGFWLTFDLSANPTLNVGSQYAFLVFLSNPDSSGGGTSGGTLNLRHTNAVDGYAGGQRLQVKNGNVLQTGDLTFVLQGTEVVSGLESVGIDSSKPTGSILAQSDPDGTGQLGFDGELSGATRYAWGQSFTATSAWTVDTITFQKQYLAALDGGRELKIAIFPMADFNSDAFGTFADPFSGQVTASVYVETFEASALVAAGDWVSFDLTTDPTLPAGSYGVAVWFNGTASTVAWDWKSSATYAGGQRLKVHEVTGNTLETLDMNFVMQGSALPAIIVGSKPSTDVLAQTTSDGGSAVGFDSELSGGTRYAWGQSFTVAAGLWSIDSIALHKLNGEAIDAGRRLKIAIFPMADYSTDDFGTYTDPFAGQTTAPLYTEIFDAGVAISGNNWVTFDLSTDVELEAGSYGVAVWLDGTASTADWDWKAGGSYADGQRLKVRGDTGNTLPDSVNMNFVVQGAEYGIPFAAFSTPNLITNGDFTQADNILPVESSPTWNVTGSNGVFSTLDGKYADVVGWGFFYSDPGLLLAATGSGQELEGTDKVGTTFNDAAGVVKMNSAHNYRNGMSQPDILSGATIHPNLTYHFVVDVLQNATKDNDSTEFTAALTVGTGSNEIDSGSAVAGALFQVQANTLPTAVDTAPQTAPIDGATLLAARSNGQVNVFFDSVNTELLVGFPGSLDPGDVGSNETASQVFIESVTLTFDPPAGDVNKDGVVNQADADLAQLYLDGDGGATAAQRQADLIGLGYTAAEALAVLNLTDFDVDGNDDFNAADKTAIEALVPADVVINSLTFDGANTVNIEASSLATGTDYYLMRETDLSSGAGFEELVDSVNASSGTETLTDSAAPTDKAFYKVIH